MLKFNAIQKITLEDTEPLNTEIGFNSEIIFNDNNQLYDEHYDVYSSGRKTLNATETLDINLDPSTIRLVYLESRLPIDIEYTQPEYVDGTTTIPESKFTDTNTGRYVMKFGIQKRQAYQQTRL